MALKCNVCGAEVISGTKCPYCGSVLVKVEEVKEETKDTGSILDKAMKSVVKVLVRYVNTDMVTFGAGCVMDNGMICTNAHVLFFEGHERKAVFVKFLNEDKDEYYQAKVLAVYDNDDVAILKPEGRIPITRGLPLGDSDQVKMGDHVFTIGNPLQQDFSYNEGVVSNPKRIHDDREDYVIQTNIDFNHGNSGGPLINKKGEIIGMATYSLINELETNVEGVEVKGETRGMGFCVSSNTIKKVIKKINN